MWYKFYTSTAVDTYLNLVIVIKKFVALKNSTPCASTSKERLSPKNKTLNSLCKQFKADTLVKIPFA